MLKEGIASFYKRYWMHRLVSIVHVCQHFFRSPAGAPSAAGCLFVTEVYPWHPEKLLLTGASSLLKLTLWRPEITYRSNQKMHPAVATANPASW